MANTSYLRYQVEPYVREILSAEFGYAFSPQFLPLSTGGRHEFDAVSADRSIIASIKTASGLTAGGRIPVGKIHACVAELYYLSLVVAPTRRLVLTTPAFFDIFKKKTLGAVAPGVEIVCVPLPPEMQAEVDLVVAEASKEVTPAAAAAALAAEVETEMQSPDSKP